MRRFWPPRDGFLGLSSIVRFFLGFPREQGELNMTRKKADKKIKAHLEYHSDFPCTIDDSVEHSVLAIRKGILSRVPNVDPDGKPRLKYKTLSSIYRDGPPSTMDSGDELSGMTLNELRIKCKKPRLNPSAVDLNLDEPLILLWQRTSNNSKTERKKNKEAVALCDDQKELPSTSDSSFYLTKVKEEISDVPKTSICSTNDLELVESVTHEREMAEAAESSDYLVIQPHENTHFEEIPSSHQCEITEAAQSFKKFAFQSLGKMDVAKMPSSHQCAITEAAESSEKFAFQLLGKRDLVEMPSYRECKMMEPVDSSYHSATQLLEITDFAETPLSHECKVVEPSESFDRFVIHPHEMTNFAEMSSSHGCRVVEYAESSDSFAMKPLGNTDFPEVPLFHGCEAIEPAQSSDHFAIQPLENVDFSEMPSSHGCVMTEATKSSDHFALRTFDKTHSAEMPSSHGCTMTETTESSDHFAFQPFEKNDFAAMPSSRGCTIIGGSESSDHFSTKALEKMNVAEMPSSHECEMTEATEPSENFEIQPLENREVVEMVSTPEARENEIFQQKPVEAEEASSTSPNSEETQPCLSPNLDQAFTNGEITGFENSTPPSVDVQSKHPPIKLMSNRKVLSPTTQEKLCQAVNSDQPVKAPRSSKRLCFERRPNSDTSSGVSTKSILKATVIDSPAQKFGHEAAAFSLRQMQDIETLATRLVKGLRSMKGVVEEALTLEGSEVIFDKMRAAIGEASNLEEVAKKWLFIMGKDCNRFCKIMRPSQHKSPNGLRKDRKKITFADEAGGMLCQVKVFKESPS